MENASVPPKTISELADRVERIREELFSVQKELEKMEPIEAAVRSAETPKSRQAASINRQSSLIPGHTLDTPTKAGSMPFRRPRKRWL